MTQILDNLMKKGVLVSPEVISSQYDEQTIKEVINFFGEDLDILDKELINNYLYNKKADSKPRVEIIKDYTKESQKRTFQDFVKIFNLRFENTASILKSRQELGSVSSINRIKRKNRSDKVATIGMILEKRVTKNKNIIIELEDPTGLCTAVIKKTDDNTELYKEAMDLVLDEVVGITGVWLGGAIFVDNIIFPDVPRTHELKKQKKEEYALFLGDTHFGGKVFMKEAFQKFIDWLNGKIGDEEHKKIISKIKYIFLAGDTIEGAGIYPGQEKDLDIIDVKDQYDDAAKWLKKIPSHIQIISTTGNHDTGRLAEPQEKPSKEFAKALYEIPNLTLVSNPAVVNVGKTQDFPGFNVLLYHGGSLIYYAENIPSIRALGGQRRVDLIMKFLLQRRHLAPTHGSTLVLPDPQEDFLFIDKVPDFFLTGHIHRASVANYNNVTMINSSAWTETTEDQIKRGLEPLPGRVTIVNLQSRDVKIINFLTKKQKEEEREKIENAAK